MPETPNLTLQVTAAAAWIMTARFIARLLNFVGLLILARLLTPSDFGIATAATALLVVGQAVTDLQFSHALIQRRTINESDWHTAFTLNVVRGGGLGVILALGGGWVANWTSSPEAAPAFAAMSIAAIISGLENPRFVLFARALSMRQEFQQLVLTHLIALSVMLGWALVAPSYWALIAGIVTQSATKTLLSYIIIGYRPRFGLKGAKQLFDFSGWLVGAATLNAINNQSDKFFILARLETDALGTYRMGQTMAMLPTTELVEPLTRGLFPAFAKMQSNRDRMRTAYLRSVQIVLLIGLPIGFGLPFVAAPFVRIALGVQWGDAATVVQFVAPVLAIQMITPGMEAAVMALGNTRKMFMRALVFGAIRIPLLYVGIVLGGLLGLLLARVLTGLINVAINSHLIGQLLDINVQKLAAESTRPFLGTGVMVLALLLAKPFLTELHDTVQIAAIMAIAGLAYVGSILVLWRMRGYPEGGESYLVGLGYSVLSRLR